MSRLRSDEGAHPTLSSVRMRLPRRETTEIPAFGRRWWWLLLLGLLAGGLAGSLAVAERPTTYRSDSTLIIGPAANLTTPREIADSLNALDRRSVVATFAALPSSRRVRRLAQRQLGLSDAQIAPYKVRTIVVPDSNILSVTVAGPDRALAANFADALAVQTANAALGFYGIYSVGILDPAELPDAPEATIPWREILAGMLLGLLIGLGSAFLLDRIVRGEDGSADQRSAADEPEFRAP